jgi:hypothetical protein
MENEEITSLDGIDIYSWYNEEKCFWEAWSVGIGDSISLISREQAIEEIERRINEEKEGVFSNE